MLRLSLDGEWELIERPLTDGIDAAPAVRAARATLATQVPGDVNDALVRAGRLPEPLVGLNFRRFDWVPERSWWHRRTFVAPAGWDASDTVELSLDGLDVHADVWLNGVYIGHHVSAFRPFERNVRKQLVAGPNELLVRLTTGRERIPVNPDFPLLPAVPTEDSRGRPERGERGRIWLRKPAYVWGWDWGPRLPTCGITGRCELRILARAEIRDVALTTRLEGAVAVVAAAVRLDWQTLVASAWGTIEVTLTDDDGHVFSARREGIFVPSGSSFQDFEIRIPDARLWWPHGSGAQHRYRVTAQAVVDGETALAEPFLYGVRTVAMENAPGRFGFRVNGSPVFIQGGNWIPPDSLYGRVTPEKIERLVAEAAAANLNCLRVWGGGRFEMDAFYEACDRLGILLWHDFMSACAPLPADDPGFADEFRAEAEFQLGRLRSRACMLLWCGNNEVGGCYAWFAAAFEKHRDPGWVLYHRLLPEVLRALAPTALYWPTSPYGGATVNEARVGDDHHWVVMRAESEFWSRPEYWDTTAIPIFNSEYGYGGPCCLESTRQYLETERPDLQSEVGREHTNTFYDIPRVNFSIGEHYRDPAGLALEEYILLGGLCQGLNLGYSLESLRANEQSMGGIFWMYDDTWGENGWTIIDYYLRRKVSFYGVKRALAPRRLVLRPGGLAFGGEPGSVVLVGLNASPEPVELRVELGYLSWDGTTRELRPVTVRLAPRSRALLGAVPCPAPERLGHGTIVAIPPDGAGFEPVAWRHCRVREMGLPPAAVRVAGTRCDGRDLLVTVTSPVFAHAVHFAIGGDWRLSDHYFDLLPGEAREVRIFDGAALDSAGLAPRGVVTPNLP